MGCNENILDSAGLQAVVTHNPNIIFEEFEKIYHTYTDHKTLRIFSKKKWSNSSDLTDFNKIQIYNGED